MDEYDIDAPVTVIQANAHDCCFKSTFKPAGRRINMPRERWMSLHDKDKQIWDQLGDHAKATILGLSGNESQHQEETHSFPSQASSKPSFSKPPSGPNIRMANLHELSAYDFLQAQMHQLDLGQDIEDAAADGNQDEDQAATESESLLINLSKSSNGKLPPGDIRHVMSKSSKRQANMANVIYNVSCHKSGQPSSLVDRGANGGLAGSDVRVIHKTHRSVDVRGIDNHQVTDIAIGTVGGVVTTQKGPVIAIMHQYALLGKGSSIHSAAQLEWFKCDVNDKSVKVGGLQHIKTLDGYTIPLSIKDGLPSWKSGPSQIRNGTHSHMSF
jgi:hypothetical protein